jgi:hypothetical protein
MNISSGVLMMWAALISISARFPDKFYHPVFINLTGSKQVFYIDIATYLVVIRAALKTAYGELLYIPESHLTSLYCTLICVHASCLKYLIAAKCTEGRGMAAKQCGEITGEKDEKAGCLAD